MTSTYLVTGCAGQIGARVSELLLDRGDTVKGIDNVNDSYDVRLKEWRLRRLADRPGFEFVRMDLRDLDGLSGLFNTRFDAVVNLAARAGVRSSVDDPRGYFETNLTGVLNLLEMCRKRGVTKFVQASTSSAYGADTPMPYREDAPANEPMSPYAASKKAAEALCYTYHFLHDIDVTVFRYFTVYGPAGRPDMVLFRLVKWISEGQPVIVYGDGKQSRDFTYVDDIARGTIAGIKTLGHEVINLGSDAPVELMRVIRLVEELVGEQASIRYEEPRRADVPATWADIGKAERLLGWRPEFSIEDGVSNLVAWYRENREWAAAVSTV